MKSLFLILLLFVLLSSSAGVVVAAPHPLQTADQAPAITSPDTATFTVGVPGSFPITTTGYPTATLNLSGALPSGLSFVDSGDGTGTVSGTPALGTGGDYRLRANTLSPIGVSLATFGDVNGDGVPEVEGFRGLAWSGSVADAFQFLNMDPDCASWSAYDLASFLVNPSSDMQTFAGDGICAATGISGGSAIADALTYNIINPRLLTIPLYDGSQGIGSKMRLHVADFALLRLTGFYLSASQNYAMTREECSAIDPSAYPSTCISAQFLASTYAPCEGTVCTDFHVNGTPLRIRASNGVAPDVSQLLRLTIYEAPTITMSDTVTFTVGASDIFTGTVGGYPQPGITISGALPTGITLTNSYLGPFTLSGTPAPGTGSPYPLTLSAHNGIGADAAQPVTLIVTEPPSVAQHPIDANRIDGEIASFTATASGYPAPSVQWQVSTDGTTWLDVSGAITNTLTFTAHLAQNGNQYRAVFTNAAGTTISNAAHLTVTFTPISIGGHVFNDLNGNGVGEANEPGVPNLTVQLSEINSSAVVTTTTDTSGNYLFTSIGPGTYRVRPVLPAGWMQTTVDPSDIAVQNGVDISGVNFGAVLPADLALTFVAAPEPATVGANAAYALTIVNQGPNIAQTVQMTTAVPLSTTFVSLTIPNGWVCPKCPVVGASGIIHCTRASMANGASSVFKLVVKGRNTLADNTVVRNNVRASAMTFDSNASNDTVGVSTTFVKRAEVSIAQRAVVNSTRTMITYILTVRNLGPAIARGVIVKDSLAGSTVLARATTTRGMCSGTTTVQCNLGPMAPGSSVTVTITVRLVRAVTQVKNTAVVTSTSPDPNMANNTSILVVAGLSP